MQKSKMKNNMSFFIIIFLIILLDIVSVRGIQKVFPQSCPLRSRNIRHAFIIQAATSVVILLIGFIFQKQSSDYRILTCYYYLFGIVTALYMPKSVYALSLLAERGVSMMHRRYRRRFGKSSRESRHLIAKCGFWTSIFFIFVVLWGILFGRYQFTVEPVEIAFDNLPQAFDGYKIVQISDVHAGSFAGSASRLQKVVDLINAQKPDLIVFTGDMVNNFAEELVPLIPIFSQLEARDGKFAVLGNHDYGGYYDWKTPTDSVTNHKAIEIGIGQMEFVVLKNQSVVINRCYADIVLMGIENWGIEKKRPKRGTIEMAMDTVRDIPFKVLLTHDPSFWREKVKGKTDIALTLAGHTHGMQMGVKLGKRYYTPAPLLGRRHQAGLFQKDKQYLYVNRGLGVIGFPGRIGMLPEITVLTLRKEK